MGRVQEVVVSLKSGSKGEPENRRERERGGGVTSPPLALEESNVAMDAAGPVGASVQKRISDQRQKLLALDYHDPFTAESLALVERLFEDLVTTTESYEDLQQRVRDRSVAELM